MLDTAVDLGAPGWDERYGCGRVDAYRSLIIGAQGPAPRCRPITDRTDTDELGGSSIVRAPFAPGEVIVELRPGASLAALRHSEAPAEPLHAAGACRLRVPAGQERATVARLRADPAILHADLNYLVFAQ